MLHVYRSILEEGKISNDCKLGVFTIVGTGGNPHATRLFPKESCTCPSTEEVCITDEKLFFLLFVSLVHVAY